MHESCSITQVERLELKASMIQSDTDKLKGEVEPEALQGISSAAELTAFIGEVLLLLLLYRILLQPERWYKGQAPKSAYTPVAESFVS